MNQPEGQADVVRLEAFIEEQAAECERRAQAAALEAQREHDALVAQEARRIRTRLEAERLVDAEGTPLPVTIACEPASALVGAPPPVQVIRDLAIVHGVTLLIGESNIGKTFLLLDLARAVSRGEPWHGRRTERGSTVYVRYEHAGGPRFTALEQRYPGALDHVYVIRMSEALSPVMRRGVERPSPGEEALRAQLRELAQAIDARGGPPLRLLAIDALRNASDQDESSSAAATQFRRMVDRIFAEHDHLAAVLPHHTGWPQGDPRRERRPGRERGSSHWRAVADVTWLAESGVPVPRQPDVNALTLLNVKQREFRKASPLHLFLRQVTIEDAVDVVDGGPVTSRLVELDPRSDAQRASDAEAARAASMSSPDAPDRVIQAIADLGKKATSIEAIRGRAGIKKPLCTELVASLLAEKLISRATPHRGAYRVTKAGKASLVKDNKQVPVPTHSGPGTCKQVPRLYRREGPVSDDHREADPKRKKTTPRKKR
jgi:hypothetical protein